MPHKRLLLPTGMEDAGYGGARSTQTTDSDQWDLFHYIKNEKINENMTEFKNYLFKPFVKMEQNAIKYNYMDENGYLVTTFNRRKCPRCKAVYLQPIKRGVCNLCYFDVMKEFEKEVEKYLDFDEPSKFDYYPGVSYFEDSDDSDNDSDANSIYSEE